eukprot:CAMPEP_0198503894 /NCGR_PEP_ID=MMETSP1462-20131121/10176_1 /TAXON_ID=1333877 /ORGANISM="Brandtodinium nutriculum, Strain RCC3387" /LENGTH=110 /DNA_ID=CAMNT_0044233041 /DNA_START=207 /DNA_END=536 /DNA_ORIENTATION=-
MGAVADRDPKIDVSDLLHLRLALQLYKSPTGSLPEVGAPPRLIHGLGADHHLEGHGRAVGRAEGQAEQRRHDLLVAALENPRVHRPLHAAAAACGHARLQRLRLRHRRAR